MAITLIGRGDDAYSLPEVELDFPAPLAPPPGSPLWTTDKLLTLLESGNAIARRFALRRLSRSSEPRATQALVDHVSDPNVEVVLAALSFIEDRDFHVAAEPVEKCLRGTTEPRVRMAACHALGRIAPERVIEILQRGPRLDDEEVITLVTSLAAKWPAGTSEYLARALNRAGAASPGRRTGIYTAVLLGPDVSLIERVLGLAIADSRKDGQAMAPARLALGVLSPDARMLSRDSGERLFRALRDAPRTGWGPEPTEKIEAALRRGKVGEAIRVVGEVVGTAPSKHEVVPRPEGLLLGLVNAARSIDELEPAMAAPFLAAALSIGTRLRVLDAAQSARAKMIEMLGVGEGAARDEIEARVRSLSNETRESLLVCLRAEAKPQDQLDQDVVVSLARAAPALVLEEAARDPEGVVFEILHFSASDATPDLEPLIVDRLVSRATSEDDLGVALNLAGVLATERTSAALGRRFYELRTRARVELLGAVDLSGDPRLFAAVKSRAFEDEVEGAVALALAAIAGGPQDPALEAAAHRWFDRPGLERHGIPLEMKCSRCGEILTYRATRVFLDPERPDRRPALAGDRKCKACGAAAERLSLTDQGHQSIRMVMLSQLAEREADDTEVPIVMPVAIEIGKKSVPLPEALEQLDADLARSPTAIRPRLKRARILMLLERSAASEDVAAVLEVDPSSAEAKLLSAQILAKKGRASEAITTLADALKTLRGGNARLYERDLPEMHGFCERLLLDFEAAGEDLPADLDLHEARVRRALLEEVIEETDELEPDDSEDDERE
ncbi:MAG: HEAT repeat domain-containing protein [Deltaproteobacteria bacterium]|nr:HEAT repeat domain-containing protein [Deltaproteobacteria bacterium]